MLYNNLMFNSGINLKENSSMRRIAAIVLTVMLAFALSGCFLLAPSKTKKKLTTYFDEDAEVVAARVFSEANKDEEGEYYICEVSPDKLDDLIDEIDATPLKSHIGVADYFYKGRYGIELTLSDGNYLIYDCTSLELSDVPFDEKESRFDNLKKDYLEDADKDFWDRIEKYFPGMEDHNFSYGW